MRNKSYPPDPLLPNSRLQALKELLAKSQEKPKPQPDQRPQEETA